MGRRKPGKERRPRPEQPPVPVNPVVRNLMSQGYTQSEAWETYEEMQAKIDAPDGVPRVRLPDSE